MRAHLFDAKTFLAAVGLLIGLAFALPAAAEDVNASGGVAIQGYDPVAYFAKSRPVKGDPAFEHVWQGARWTFSSAENRDRFAADPARYAPRYGGYCAVGMAHGHKVQIDPAAWSIVGDQLYLTYNRQVLDAFKQDTQGHISKADANWRNLGG